MADLQLARGLWSGFAPTEDPFNVPNGMEANLRTVDDHLALYTLQGPLPMGSPLPPNPIPGDGQIFTDGRYAVFNAGSWQFYPARKGIRATLGSGTDAWDNTGFGWTQFSAEVSKPALEAVIAAGNVFVGEAQVARDAAVAASNAVPYKTLAELQASTPPEPGAEVLAIVTNDAELSKNGYYTWSGSEWEKSSLQPASASDVHELKSRLATADSVEDIAIAVRFKNDARTWMEAGQDGLPTSHASNVIQGVVGVKPVASDSGVALAMQSVSGQFLSGFRASGEPIFLGPVPYVASGYTAFGDSTTFGDGLTSTHSERWTTLLGARLGVHIENRGVNGAKSGDIASRYGALSPVMTVSGGSIPASGSVTLNAIDLNPTRGAPAFPVEILCEGGERISGTLLPSNFASATFTRYTAGTAVNTTRVRIISRMSEQSRRRVLFCGMGVNDEADIVAGTVKTSAIKSFYRSISIAQAAAKARLVVWGMLDRGLGEAPGTPIGNFIVEIEQFLLEEFGANFAPVRQFLSSSYGLTIAARLQPSFVPTLADSDAIAAGVTPPSYRVGGTSVHLNPLGHQLQAWFFHQYLITRGMA